MSCSLTDICGGCPLRSLDEAEYRRGKIERFERLVAPLKPCAVGEAVFIGDGTRRRAVLAFRSRKGKLQFGFNRSRSDEITDIEHCPLLTPRLNRVLPDIRRLLEALTAITVSTRVGRKIETRRLSGGDVAVTEAVNGIDLLLDLSQDLSLEHRMTIFEMVSAFPDIIRVSFRSRPEMLPEPVIEKNAPYINIAGYQVFIPAGTFLQPSFEGERALTGLVMKYAEGCRGKIADLFCGVGTFSYPLSRLPGVKITAVDSSPALLEGFRRSLNKNQISDIEIVEKNLFKYPLDTRELSAFELVVFDPPRAGALAQVKNLAALPVAARPARLIAVSCNPESFVRDARILREAGYILREVTLVDQFTYSEHSEVVALFTNPEN